MGTIEAMDLEDQLVAIRFGDRLVAYDYADLMELAHGYCVTVHKSQGSEYPAVVLPLHTSHFLMLSRNLLYTALTRARKTVVIIGSTRAIAIAIELDRGDDPLHRPHRGPPASLSDRRVN
jgi:exodeoxyribonuclease V alpha subunit